MSGADTTSNKAGLAALLEQLRPELLRFLTARCGNPDEAQDLMQELWFKIADTDTGPIGNPRAYIYRAANNLVLDGLRTRQRAMVRDRRWLADRSATGEAALDPEDPAQPADDALIEAEEAQILRSAVDSLPPGARRALQLYRFEGRKQGEIAEIMGISRSGVEKHLVVAMKHLRDALANSGFLDAAASQMKQTMSDRGSGKEGGP